MRRRTLLQMGGSTVTVGLAGCIARSTSTDPLVIRSSAFGDGGTLPGRFTCDGRGVSPPLTIESTPEDTTAFAVVARSTSGVFGNPVLWTCWNILRDASEIPAGIPRTATPETFSGVRQGTASDGDPGYRPVCPPKNQSTEYWVQVYALDAVLDTPAGAPNEDALDAIETQQIASDRITVRYTRTGTPTRNS